MPGIPILLCGGGATGTKFCAARELGRAIAPVCRGGCEVLFLLVLLGAFAEEPDEDAEEGEGEGDADGAADDYGDLGAGF